MVGTTSSGQPKNDTFIFEGETTDGIITKLNFDIIRNKGSEDEYSKKDIMGYLMNISDATVEKTEDGYRLATLSAYGYDPAYSDGDTYYAQYMLTASCENLTEDTVFADLSFSDLAQHGNVVTVEKACIAYGYLAREAGLELTACMRTARLSRAPTVSPLRVTTAAAATASSWRPSRTTFWPIK